MLTSYICRWENVFFSRFRVRLVGAGARRSGEADEEPVYEWEAKEVAYLWWWPRWSSTRPSWRNSTSCGRCTWSCRPRTRCAAAPRTRSASAGPSASIGPRPSAGWLSTARPGSPVSRVSRRTCRISRTRPPCTGTPGRRRRTSPPARPVGRPPSVVVVVVRARQIAAAAAATEQALWVKRGGGGSTDSRKMASGVKAWRVRMWPDIRTRVMDAWCRPPQ